MMEEPIRIKQSEVLDLINAMSDGEKTKIGNYAIWKVNAETFKLSNLIDADTYASLVKDTLGEVELID